MKDILRVNGWILLILGWVIFATGHYLASTFIFGLCVLILILDHRDYHR